MFGKKLPQPSAPAPAAAPQVPKLANAAPVVNAPSNQAAQAALPSAGAMAPGGGKKSPKAGAIAMAGASEVDRSTKSARQAGSPAAAVDALSGLRGLGDKIADTTEGKAAWGRHVEGAMRAWSVVENAATRGAGRGMPASTKGSGGGLGFPDVCKVPAPPAPFVPVPYPNVGKLDTLTKDAPSPNEVDAAAQAGRDAAGNAANAAGDAANSAAQGASDAAEAAGAAADQAASDAGAAASNAGDAGSNAVETVKSWFP